MRGTKTKRSENTWRLRVYTGTSPTGSPTYVSKEFRGGSREADDALRRLVEDVTHTAGRTTTVAELLERWLNHIAVKNSLSTMQGYRNLVAGRLIPVFGDTRLDKLTGAALDAAYQRWLTEPRGGTGVTGVKPLAPATVRQCHAVMAAALHQAVKWGWIGVSPAERATAPTVRTAQTAAITVDELQAILAAAKIDDPVNEAAFAIAAVTGVRRGELCALRWSDVDMDMAVLRVSRSLTVIAKQVTVGPTKTHQARILTLGPLALQVLTHRRTYQEKLAAEGGSVLVDDPYILSHRLDGAGPCLPDTLTHAFARVCRRLNLPFHLHDLRHFSATTAIAAGVDPRTVATRLGHSNPSVTLRIYAHALEANDRAAAEILDRALAPA